MWKKILFVLSLLVGLAAFCAVPMIVGWDDTWNAIGGVGWPCVGVFLLNSTLVLVAPAIGWRIIMRGEGMEVSLMDTLRANLMGLPLNFITPSMYLGGEPLKLYYIAGKHRLQKRRVLATIIVAKFQEIASIVLLGIVAVGVFIWRADYFTKRNEILLVLLMAVLTVLTALLFAAFVGNFKLTVRIINFLARLGFARRRLARLRSKAEDMEHLIHLACTKRWKTFLAAQFVTLFSSVSVLSRPCIYFYFARQGTLLGAEHVSLIYLISNFLNLFTIIPGSLGIFEGGMTAYFATSKELGQANGLAFSLLSRISDLLLVALGTWLIVHLGLSKFAKGVAKGESQLSEAEIKDAIQSEEEAAGT